MANSIKIIIEIYFLYCMKQDKFQTLSLFVKHSTIRFEIEIKNHRKITDDQLLHLQNQTGFGEIGSKNISAIDISRVKSGLL